MLRIASQSIHTLDGMVVASEVLVRLQAGHRIVSPDVFMKGHNPHSWFGLDHQVLRMVRHSKALAQSKVPTFVNVSPATLERDDFMHTFCAEVEVVADTLRSPLVIEMPEKCPLDGSKLLGRIDDIKAAGAHVALDDYGSVHADLARLKLCHWNYCKVDLPALAKHTNLDWLHAGIRHANENGIQLIMEKLESTQGLDLLTPVKKSSWYQGYFFSRPELVNTRQEAWTEEGWEAEGSGRLKSYG